MRIKEKKIENLYATAPLGGSKGVTFTRPSVLGVNYGRSRQLGIPRKPGMHACPYTIPRPRRMYMCNPEFTHVIGRA